MGKTPKYRNIHSKWHGQNRTSSKASSMLSLLWAEWFLLTLALSSGHRPKEFHTHRASSDPFTSNRRATKWHQDVPYLLVLPYSPNQSVLNLGQTFSTHSGSGFLAINLTMTQRLSDRRTASSHVLVLWFWKNYNVVGLECIFKWNEPAPPVISSTITLNSQSLPAN